MRPELPAYLIAFPFLSHWHQRRGGQRYRQWIMDSGAFSAMNSGKPVNRAEFHDAIRAANDSADPPRYVFGLDVIGDWRESLKNCEAAWSEGLEVIPTYHHGEPEDYLRGIARDYPMIALGGVAGGSPPAVQAWATRCFQRIWPCRVHGFSLCAKRYVTALPFYSVDSTAWFLQAIRYHRFAAHGGAFLPRARPTSLRAEIEKHLRLEEYARVQWKREMVELGVDGPVLYLANPHGNGPAWEGLTGYETEEALANV